MMKERGLMDRSQKSALVLSLFLNSHYLYGKTFSIEKFLAEVFFTSHMQLAW